MPDTPVKPDRASVRARILASRAPKSEVIMFFGEQIELRQPTLGAVLDSQTKEDRRGAMIDLIIERAYIPGTDELVFELADSDTLRALPFGADWIRVNKAMEALSEVNFLDNENDLSAGQLN